MYRNIARTSNKKIEKKVKNFPASGLILRSKGAQTRNWIHLFSPDFIIQYTPTLQHKISTNTFPSRKKRQDERERKKSAIKKTI